MKRHSILFVIFGAALWGTDAVFRRPLTRELSPVTIVFLEHCVLSLVLLPVLLGARREILRLKVKDFGALAFIALAGSVAATSLFTYSIKYGNPSVTILLQKTQPLFAIGLARWLLGERPERRFWGWLAPALAGAWLISAPDWSGLVAAPWTIAPVLAAIAASLLWGASTVFGRYAAGKIKPAFLTGMRFLLALPLLALLYRLQIPPDRVLPSGPAQAGTLVAMALIPGLAALLFYYEGLRATPASLAAIGELAFPFTAVIVNWIFLDVHLTPVQFLGGALLVTSVTAMSWRREAGGEIPVQRAPVRSNPDLPSPGVQNMILPNERAKR